MHSSRALLLLVISAVAPAVACAVEPAAKPAAGGIVAGRIILDGDALVLPPFFKAGDEKIKDKEVCGVADVPDESLVVGEGKGISNVFVYKCDIHGWMASYHLVLDHPFMAVTDKDGNFKIEGLPAGTHEFRIWHERGGPLEKEYKVDVKDGAEKTLELKYSAAKFAGKKKG